MSKTFYTLCLFVATSITLAAQVLEATSGAQAPFTPQNLISDIFLGDGVEVISISFNGDPAAVGYFTGGSSVIGLDRGIVLTTGLAESGGAGTFGCDAYGNNFASTPNAGGSADPNLGALVSVGLNDVASYTITFIPTDSILRFRYCFASEEYPEYACSPYNDVFGFFIQGPNYPIAKNIALIPNTNLPVTINNIHPANPAYFPCFPTNAQYYNSTGNAQPTYDGFTDVLTAFAKVVPCQQYTIRLAIADASDSSYDSGVFLEAKSFSTGSLQVKVKTASLDGVLTEGCAQGEIVFSIPQPISIPYKINYTLGGTALSGADYTPINPNLTIPAGQTELVVPINSLEDGLVEGLEVIVLDVQVDPCNRDTFYIPIRDNILVPPVLRSDTLICLGTPIAVDGTLAVALPPAPSFTNTQDVPIAPINTPITSSVNVFGVLPATLDSAVIRSVCINIDHLFDDDLDIFLISPGGQFIELTTDNGAGGDNYTNTCFTPVATQPITYGMNQAPQQYAPFTGDFQPEGVWSDLWGGPSNGTWTLQMKDDANGAIGTLRDWTITFEPIYKVNYEWLPAAGIACANCPATIATPTQPGLYTLEATDSYGCIVKDSVYFDVKPVLPPPVIDCGDLSSNFVTFVWDSIPGSIGYEININGTGWITPQSAYEHIVNGLVPYTNVSIEVRGINDPVLCDAQVSAKVCSSCIPPKVTHTTTPATCFNTPDGTVTMVPDGLNPPYTFRLGSASNNNGIFTALAGGNYVGTVTDATGCDTLIPFSIFAPPAIVPNVAIQQNISCFGGADGALSVAITGGTGIVSILWSDAAAQVTNSATGLTVGNYTVTLTDALGCSTTATGVLQEPGELIATASATPAKCYGTETGALVGSGTGGTMPYSLVWSGNYSGTSVNNVYPGQYLLTLLDAKGCFDTISVEVGQPAEVTVSMLTTPTNCSTSTDGTATAVPLGGILPYTYQWNTTPIQTTVTANNLAVQTYTVTATDSNGCTATNSGTITSPQALTSTISQVSTSCNGGSDGTATVVPNGGNGAYTYQWSSTGTPQTAATATGLSFGIYTVTITDAKGCTATNLVSVSQPPPVLVTGFTIPTSCFGFTDGQIKTNVSGGTSPYTYLWSTGDQLTELNDKIAGTYTVTITDSKGCTGKMSLTVTQPPALVVGLSPSPVLCFNGSSGKIATQVSGGTGGYTYLWYGPNNYISYDPNNDTLFAGSYSLTITDNSGCKLIETIEVLQPAAPLQIEIPYISDTVCFEAKNGRAKVFPTGGTTPYSFVWDDSTGQTQQFPKDLAVDLYRVTVTDANGCYGIDSTYIIQKSELFAYVVDSMPRCYNGSDGYANVIFMSYGSQEVETNLFSYVWSNGQTGTLATGLSAGSTYYVTATDSDGCTDVQTTVIRSPAVLTNTFIGNKDLLCAGVFEGVIEAVGEGGTAPYTYFWSPNVGVAQQNNQTVSGLNAGTYQVTVTDSKNCQATRTTTLTEPPLLGTKVTATDVNCFGGSDGTALVVASGGVSPYSYQWENGASAKKALGLTAGIFAVTVTDKNGCTRLDSIELSQPSTPLSGGIQPTDATCYGARDGRIEITGTGGTPPYRYALNNKPYNGSPLQIGLTAGLYTPRVIDAHGCELELSVVEIKQRDPIILELGPDITIELGTSTELQSEIRNGLDPLLIEWSPEDSTWLSCLTCRTPTVDGLLFENTFEAVVTDALGCRAEDFVRIFIDKPRKVYVPTGFTPNADGNNDLLLVHGQQSAKILNIKIFDRWGEMVYEASDFDLNDANIGWDGTFRGKELNPGVFVWMLEVEYLDGVTEVLQGQTTLIR